MQRLPLATLLVFVLALLARAWVRPVYVGAPDAAAMERTFGFAQPFGDDLKGASDAFHTMLADSVRREGLAATGGWPLMNRTHVPTDRFFYYDHHPPGVTLLTALAFEWCGMSEAVARAVALICSTLTLLVLAALAWRVGGERAALFTMVVVAATPAGLYWASHLDYPVPTMAACALFLALAGRDDLRGAGRCVAGLALLAALSFDFLAVLAPAALFLDRLVAGPRGAKRLLGWPLLGAAWTVLLLTWKHLQLSRYGISDTVAPLGQVEQIWNLPIGMSVAEYLRRVEGHLRALVTPLGEGLLCFGIVRSLLPGSDPQLRRFVRTTTLLALAAGLLPRMRAQDHPYFQLYWLLPLGGSAALLALSLLGARRSQRGSLDAAAALPPSGPPSQARLAMAGVAALFAAMVAGAFLLAGGAAHPRSTIAPDRPSSHLLGRELATKVPPECTLVLVPATTPLEGIQLTWYAGRMVAKALDDPPDRSRTIPFLGMFTLDQAPAWWAPGVKWPGRDGVTRLPDPAPSAPPPPR